MHASSQVQETIIRLVPGSEQSLNHLADDELLNSTRRLVGASNKLFAQLLLHLAEVETRGIHRARACASLYTYCIYELRMSEDAAARRSSAARLVKRFPLLFDAIAGGELHLTGVLMLGPYLTPENHVEVLARAKFRTKKEIAKLVRELHPLPGVPDLIEPLGPELPRSPRKPTWNEWVTSLCPPVRELAPGESPRDWANDIVDGAEAKAGEAEAEAEAGVLVKGELGAGVEDPFTALARRQLPPVAAPQQYQMQFSTDEEHVRLVERAKALLARSSPGVSLGQLHRQAMQLLVEKLEKDRFGAGQRPRKAPQAIPTPSPPKSAASSGQPAPARSSGEPAPAGTSEAERVEPAESTQCKIAGEAKAFEPTRAATRQRGRHIPAAVKREVFERDGGCCNYVDQRGQRCGETRYLEMHHLKAFARGGEHVASNLALRCAAHNALAAEADFGRGHIEQKRHS